MSSIFLYLGLTLSILAPIYTYVLYPFILIGCAIFIKKEYEINRNYLPFVSVLVAAYNEEKVIEEKILNLIQIAYPANRIEFLIGSDGSSDRTVEIANSYAHISNLKVFDLPRGGKVNVLNTLLKKAKGEVLVFSDANTIFNSQAVLELVKYFNDERIGCASGQLRYRIDESSGHGAKSESTYWKYENWVKALESKIGRLSGANGAIYAIRKGLVREIRKGIINDDFYVANYVLQSGYDVILETKAIAYEEPNDEFKSQFNRHIRDGAGHYQAVLVFWRMLFPRKGSFVHISHRVIRWTVPLFLILAFLFNASLVGNDLFANMLFVCQTFGYLVMLTYYLCMVRSPRNKKCNENNKNIMIRCLNIIFYFLSVNLALLLGFVKLLKKQQKATWETQR